MPQTLLVVTIGPIGNGFPILRMTALSRKGVINEDAGGVIGVSGDFGGTDFERLSALRCD